MAHALPPLPPGIRLLADDERERLYDQFPTTPTKPGGEQCVTCRGKGEFRWYLPGSWELDTYECPCEDQWVAYRYLLHCGIGNNYQRLGWRDVAVEPRARQAATDWLRHADDWIHRGIGLFFRGGPGTGKTLLATLVLKHLLGEGYDGYFTTFNEMIGIFTEGWRDASERRLFHRRIKNSRVLVIDDPGKEWSSNREVTLPQALLDEVIRHRISAATPTIITTNEDDDLFRKRYGRYVHSMLREAAITHEFVGADWRDDAMARTKREREQGIVRPILFDPHPVL